jgi:methylmalonyl-CoA mutase
MSRNPLVIAAFPRFSEDEWRALAATSVGLERLDSLAARTDDGIVVAPIYPAGRAAPTVPVAHEPWMIVTRVDTPHADEAPAIAHAATESGADTIALVFDTSPVARGAGLSPDLPAGFLHAFRGPAGDRAPIAIDAGAATAGIVSVLASSGLRLSGFILDPAATLAARGAIDRPLEGLADDALAAAGCLAADGRAILADGRPWHDGGASEVEELAAVVGALVAGLRRAEAAGLDLDALAGHIGVALAADTDQFLTIAKFRAARLLVGRILETAGVAGAVPFVHGETAWRTMSRRDPHTNLIRATTAAFAAAAGGADSITVLPLTGIGDEAFARRMAVNTQLVLREESQLWRVADPGAGSGAVEALTGALAAAAWDRFRAIEAEGGLFAAVRAGSLQRAVAATRAERLARVADRRIELVGVNVFAETARDAAPPAVALAARGRPAAPAEQAEALLATALAAPFEAGSA